MSTDRRRFDPFAPRRKAQTDAPPPSATPQGGTPQAVASDRDDYAALLPADLDDITKPDLIELAELAGVATYGTKEQIAQRIRDAK